jgi:hypothetical protein
LVDFFIFIVLFGMVGAPSCFLVKTFFILFFLFLKVLKTPSRVVSKELKAFLRAFWALKMKFIMKFRLSAKSQILVSVVHYLTVMIVTIKTILFRRVVTLTEIHISWQTIFNDTLHKL